jgi:hypothetical protein
MATSYWKTLKTVDNLAEKPDNTPGTCLILANSFLGCDQIWLKFQESAKEYFILKFFWVKICTSSPGKKRGCMTSKAFIHKIK